MKLRKMPCCGRFWKRQAWTRALSVRSAWGVMTLVRRSRKSTEGTSSNWLRLSAKSQKAGPPGKKIHPMVLNRSGGLVSGFLWNKHKYCAQDSVHDWDG